MNEAIAFYSLKGGVGKSGVCLGIAGALKQRGIRCLIFDLDPGARTPTIRYGLANSREDLRGLILGSIELEQAIHTIDEQISILPCGPGAWELENSEEVELHLPGVFEAVRGMNAFEFILCDLPPGLTSSFVEQGLLNANWLISPVKSETDATSTLDTTARLVWEAKKNGASLRWMGVVISLYRSQTTSSRLVLRQLQKDLKEKKIPVFKSIIPLSVVAPESGLYGSDPVSHAPNSKLAVRFGQLTEEILKIVDDDVRSVVL